MNSMNYLGGMNQSLNGLGLGGLSSLQNLQNLSGLSGLQNMNPNMLGSTIYFI